MIARRIHVTRDEFDDLLYPAFDSKISQSDQEVEVAIRAARCFREGPTQYEEIADDERKRMALLRQKPVPFLKLVAAEYTFIVDDDVLKMLLDRYMDYKKNIPDARILEREEFLQKLREAFTSTVE